jgi:hypothetical protein
MGSMVGRLRGVHVLPRQVRHGLCVGRLERRQLRRRGRNFGGDRRRCACSRRRGDVGRAVFLGQAGQATAVLGVFLTFHVSRVVAEKQGRGTVRRHIGTNICNEAYE